MNARELRAKLEGVPDEAVIVVEARDHEYREAEARVDTGLLDRGTWTEDIYNGAVGEQTEYGARKHIVLIA